MNGREVLVCTFAHEYLVKCYEPENANPVHQWTTDNVLAVGVIIQLWIQFGHNEELMTRFISDII